MISSNYSDSANSEMIFLEACSIVKQAKKDELKTVLTSGCFDLIHMGHILYLEEARNLGDMLIVAVNSDISIKSIKGNSRPILDELQRIKIIESLKFVDCAFLFNSRSIADHIRIIRPDVFVIGEESVYEYPDEISAANDVGANIHIIQRVSKYSSSFIINRIRSIK